MRSFRSGNRKSTYFLGSKNLQFSEGARIPGIRQSPQNGGFGQSRRRLADPHFDPMVFVSFPLMYAPHPEQCAGEHPENRTIGRLCCRGVGGAACFPRPLFTGGTGIRAGSARFGAPGLFVRGLLVAGQLASLFNAYALRALSLPSRLARASTGRSRAPSLFSEPPCSDSCHS
jgi:hypothetical protein